MGSVRALAALAIAAALAWTGFAEAAPKDGIKLKPTAGRFDPDTFKRLGNSTDAQAQWTNKAALDGKFSVLLEKSVPTSEYAFAAAIVDGAEGRTVAELGDIGFSVKGACGGGSPRFNLFYDGNGDGEANAVAFYGCGNHVTGSPALGWTSMLADASFPDSEFDFGGEGPLTDASVVGSLSVIVDEQGTYHVDRVQAAGKQTGEPNGSG